MAQPQIVATQCLAAGSSLPRSSVFVGLRTHDTLGAHAASDHDEDKRADQAYEALYQWLGISTSAPAWLVGVVSTPDGCCDTPISKPSCCERCQKEVDRRMPTLHSLRDATKALHELFAHAFNNSDRSDAWASSWRVGDPNNVPYNHHAAIQLMIENARFLRECGALLHECLEEGSNAPDAVEAWMRAWSMHKRLRRLSQQVPWWADLTERYGQLSAPLGGADSEPGL
jgi:hypothetical protein